MQAVGFFFQYRRKRTTGKGYEGETVQEKSKCNANFLLSVLYNAFELFMFSQL